MQAGANLRLMKWFLVNIKYSYLSMPDLKVDASSQSDIKAKFKNGVQAVGLGVTVLL